MYMRITLSNGAVAGSAGLRRVTHKILTLGRKRKTARRKQKQKKALKCSCYNHNYKEGKLLLLRLVFFFAPLLFILRHLYPFLLS